MAQAGRQMYHRPGLNAGADDMQYRIDGVPAKVAGLAISPVVVTVIVAKGGGYLPGYHAQQPQQSPPAHSIVVPVPLEAVSVRFCAPAAIASASAVKLVDAP